jgi:hypothetical protein
MREAVLAAQREMAAAANKTNAPLEPADLYVDFGRSVVPGWLREGIAQDERIEAWRVQNAILWREQLVEPTFGLSYARDTTLADWLVPFIRLELIRRDSKGYTDFWYREIEASSVPRNWMRWAVDLVQSRPAIAIGPGNPDDGQLSSYLFDADVFMTGDRRFGRVLEAVRAAAPVPFARTAYVAFKPDDLIATIEGALLQPAPPPG